VRFIGFSGEEQGLLGSQHYVDQLTKKDVAGTLAMLDFDMLGSPNRGRFVYDGDGSDGGPAGPAGTSRRTSSTAARTTTASRLDLVDPRYGQRVVEGI
jgi:Zn-dependent M28 family amino/carboxypeptidase